jgi:hypothetical protein
VQKSTLDVLRRIKFDDKEGVQGEKAGEAIPKREGYYRAKDRIK